MEHQPSPTTAAWVSNSKDLFAQVTAAVAHCHYRWVCHRDLKPENLLIDAELKVFVVDFGLSQKVWRPRVCSQVNGIRVPFSAAELLVAGLTALG